MISANNLKKKILYRSSHRGTKEMDLLIGRFVEKNIGILSESELKELLEVLNFSDDFLHKLYFTTTLESPYNSMSVLKKFREFKI